jgi:hypothetical protein
MRAMFLVVCLCVVSLQQPSFGQAIVVPNDNMRLRPVFLDDQLLNVSRSPSFQAANCEDPFCSYLVFDYENGVLDFGGEQFLGRTGDWYLVSFGDTFSEATTHILPPVFLEGVLPRPPVEVGTSDFYLGVELDGSTYGWVQLKPIDGVVTMVANAVSYSSRGIIVGTLNVVPEPSSAGLAFIGLAALCPRRARDA